MWCKANPHHHRWHSFFSSNRSGCQHLTIVFSMSSSSSVTLWWICICSWTYSSPLFSPIINKIYKYLLRCSLHFDRWWFFFLFQGWTNDHSRSTNENVGNCFSTFTLQRDSDDDHLWNLFPTDQSNETWRIGLYYWSLLENFGRSQSWRWIEWVVLNERRGSLLQKEILRFQEISWIIIQFELRITTTKYRSNIPSANISNDLQFETESSGDRFCQHRVKSFIRLIGITRFVCASLFRAIISALIVGNAACLAASYNALEWFFLSAFVLEALLKMYAIGVNEYFHHRWNIFDFTIVFVSTTYSLLSAFVPHCKTIDQEQFLFIWLFSVVTLNRDVLDAILVVRVLRLVKLVGNVERFETTMTIDSSHQWTNAAFPVPFSFKAIFGTLSKVIPTLMTYLRVMFVSWHVAFLTLLIKHRRWESFRWLITFLQWLVRRDLRQVDRNSTSKCLGMEIFKNRIEYSERNDTLAMSCGNMKLNNSEFARSVWILFGFRLFHRLSVE